MYDQLCDMYLEYITWKLEKCSIIVLDGYGSGATTKDNIPQIDSEVGLLRTWL